MQTIDLSQQTAETSERDPARKLRQQVLEWKTIRGRRERTAADVPVERYSRRRPPVERLSARRPPFPRSFLGTLFIRIALVLVSFTTGERT
jgi:hypothetical protein